jgi:polar amino acid transport system substrate-binding protein
MKQLTQKLKSGEMRVLEVPVPDLRPGMILVRNYYSLISAGTESSTVKTARKGYIGKAKERPRQVKQVIDTLMNQGPVQTYRAVMKKLDAYSPLGYSCVGEVIGIGGQRTEVRSRKSEIRGQKSVVSGQMSGNKISHSEFHIGDLVACGGATASHCEVVAVPANLCVKLQSDADMKQAVYNTLGAIAMQGVRQADLRLGETCAIIGMGLLGQLTATLLRATAVRVVGVDIDQAMVDIAGQHSADLALDRDSAGIESRILEYTNGIGCDAVIITAASSSLDPINFAGAILRKKGTVVVVGDVPTGFDREPDFYKKEIIVKMSCSYGPGRYDAEYEEKGRDYPVAYVRWTENRNMQAFQEMISSGKIDISYLTTHVFKLEDAPVAYDMIVERPEPFVGILIAYDRDKEITKESVQVRSLTSDLRSPTSVSIGFIGAGSYAQSYLLPNIPKGKDVVLKGVMTSTSTSSRSVADRFGFEFCTGNEDDVLKNDEINTIFIATRHDSHGYYVKKALEAGKNVFIEKPLCLTAEELGQIVDLLNSYNQKNNSNEDTTQQINGSRITSNGVPLLMVGYNRRFSPLTEILKDKMGSGTMSMIYRINAGAVPADSWIQDMEIGGGRILGEVCHFVDYLTYINGSLPVSVFAAALDDANNHNDTLTVSLKYQNGSVGSIQYFANGSKSLAKEYVEIYSYGVTAILNDFRQLKIYGKGRPYRKKLMSTNNTTQ